MQTVDVHRIQIRCPMTLCSNAPIRCFGRLSLHALLPLMTDPRVGDGEVAGRLPYAGTAVRKSGCGTALYSPLAMRLAYLLCMRLGGRQNDAGVNYRRPWLTSHTHPATVPQTPYKLAVKFRSVQSYVAVNAPAHWM